MKVFKIALILTISFFYSELAFCQDKIYKEHVSTKILIDKNSVEEVKKENIDLQSFVESVYVNSSKFYNQALPAIKKGEYYVLIDYSDGLESKRVTTKELKDISVDKIEEFTYKKSYIYGALHGTYGKMFGIVVLKLKKQH
jgi:hypothetical protein